MLQVADATTSSLSAVPGWVVLVTIAAIILLSGVVVIVGRYYLEIKNRTSSGAQPSSDQSSDSNGTLVRSWIAISLVSGLLVFCAVALTLGNAPLQNTLFGGLIASVGAAVAFYFSSKSAEQARQDVMNASQTTTDVPNLHGLTVSEAGTSMAKTPLQLVLQDPNAGIGDKVVNQTPSANSQVRTGTKVTVSTESPVAGDSH